MKFTEGYWLPSERSNASYATEAYEIEQIPGGMRILATTRKIENRGMTLNLPTITLEFVFQDKDTLSMEVWHYEGYDAKAPSFEKNETIYQDTTLTVTEEEALLDNGTLQVRVNRQDFSYSIEADGKVLTSSGFHNLAYIRWDKKASTMLPEANYMSQDYKPYMVSELSLQAGECVYGLGERFTAFVKNGQVVDTWNEDGGTASEVAYKSIPFYMTNRGYGVLVDSTDNVSFEVASEKVEYVGFSVPGERIKYYLFFGPTPKEVIGAYTRLTGRPALPPAWSFGLWLSTSFTTNYDEKTTTSFIEGMEERNLPLSVFHFDCFWMKEFHWCDFEWDKRFFPDIKSTLKKYHDKGLRICAWINPYIAQGTDFFREGVKNGYLVKRADGMGVWQTDNWQAGMGLVDFTNPDAVRWYTDKLRTILDCGVDCFKTDFGERIPVDVVYHDGSNPQAMHNYYTYLYNKAVFELLESERGDNEAVLFARSATAGGQKFPVHWGGDCSANYPSMAETLRGGLSFAMSGFSFWSHDISGFESTATPDLYKRWAAFGLMSTHSRLHGSGSYRVPWLFDEEACDVVKFFTNLKCRLMPYIYQKSVEAHEEGTPVMRPMIFDFPEDPAVRYLDQQYMLGESLLVAPVFCEDHSVEYYLPDGIWTDLLTGESKEGGRWFKGSYDYFSMPLYIRENSILVMGSKDEKPDYDYSNCPTIRIYQPKEGQEAVAKIPDLKGNTISTIKAVSENGKLTLTVEGQHTDMQVEIYVGNEKKEAVIKETEQEICVKISRVLTPES
ncbi:MAG TPA: alpha-xylosidase [Candidatus Pelethocola excrementipullorum]|nr:alpha-xylosidase [Candidatus Pelethocola excrementipullorum]